MGIIIDPSKEVEGTQPIATINFIGTPKGDIEGMSTRAAQLGGYGCPELAVGQHIASSTCGKLQDDLCEQYWVIQREAIKEGVCVKHWWLPCEEGWVFAKYRYTSNGVGENRLIMCEGAEQMGAFPGIDWINAIDYARGRVSLAPINRPNEYLDSLHLGIAHHKMRGTPAGLAAELLGIGRTLYYEKLGELEGKFIPVQEHLKLTKIELWHYAGFTAFVKERSDWLSYPQIGGKK